ncbi:MAG: hypothetical protein ACP5OU_10425 [Methanothrix sp.]
MDIMEAGRAQADQAVQVPGFLERKAIGTVDFWYFKSRIIDEVFGNLNMTEFWVDP